MARRVTSKNELIECPYCGEKYAVTYKHCPFCNEDGTGRWDDPAPEEEYVYEDEERTDARGGKRLVGGGGGRRGPSAGRIIGTILSLALIVAAGCIVFSLVRSLVGGEEPTPTPTPTAPVTETTTPTGTPSEEPSAPASETPAVPTTPATDPTLPPAPTVPAVEIVAPTSFKISHSDVTLDHMGETFNITATYTPANARGDITWKSSNPNVASVSWDGKVTAVSRGTVTITATVAGVGEKSCIVRCNFKSSGGSTTTTTPAPTATPAASSGSASSSLSLSRKDFTLAFAGDKWTLKVSGTSSTPTWSSTNTSVATVSANGTVTAVAKGTCKVKATVDGVTLECIVRCTW